MVSLPSLRERKDDIPLLAKTFLDNLKKNTVLPEVGEMSLEEVEVTMIKKAMNFHQNKITEAAKSLGISRNALYRRLEKHKIEFEE